MTKPGLTLMTASEARHGLTAALMNQVFGPGRMDPPPQASAAFAPAATAYRASVAAPALGRLGLVLVLIGRRRAAKASARDVS
jgi:hypothetical protein